MYVHANNDIVMYCIRRSYITWYDGDIDPVLSTAALEVKEHIRVVEELSEDEISSCIDFFLQIYEFLFILGLR